VHATVLNISTYRFVALEGLDGLRDRIERGARDAGLCGTVLLAPEGINLAVAGDPPAARRWLAALGGPGGTPALAGLVAKESFSTHRPFERLKVRIKREIIRMNRPQVRPQEARAPALAPATLARWVTQGHDDEGRPLRLLDTRNAFEVDAGRFAGALDWRLQRFSDFPDALERDIDSLRDCTVVSYCTGGIRCEKAALLLQAAGLTHSWQLDGGILGYFEQTGGAAPGWEGECVVFDGRGALRPDLAAVEEPTP
jgi:UPF0176 protein